ncbi:ac102 [Psilogramma increta granulovirus]|uniref:Ac102 n=1 Tax=Psilogramma increta granulovirus TaxID=2953508 RepID=A0A977TNW8_9BBAC|nr:ac102 [Psilogramma increta granulovirus]
MEEDSLFINRDGTGGVNNNGGGNVSVTSPNNEVLIQALLMQGIGRDIRNDTSVGKINVLKRMTPKTRNLKRLIKGLEEEGGDELLIKGADDAVDILEVIYGIVNSKFLLEPERMEL